jgi:shikimate kinase
VSGYYDPHPLVVLTRPLTLVGHPGSGVAQVAHALTAQTGLPLNDVDRLVESMAGRSLARLWREQGRAAVRSLELEVLRRALARKPPGVIALRSESLVDERARTLVRELSCVVVLLRPPEVLRRRLVDRFEAVREVPDPDAFERILAEREPVVRDAEVRLDAGDRHPQRIADELQASLDRIVGVE